MNCHPNKWFRGLPLALPIPLCRQHVLGHKKTTILQTHHVTSSILHAADGQLPQQPAKHNTLWGQMIGICDGGNETIWG